MPEEIAKSAKTVVMACKLPGGLRMRLFKMYEEAEPVMGGGSRMVQRARQEGPSIVLNGCAIAVGGQMPKHQIVGGYGLTTNVPADFAEEWMKQNSESALVKEGLVWVVNSRDAAEKKATDMEEVRSNLEPLDVTTSIKKGQEVHNDPRWPRTINPNVTTPQTADRKAS